MNTFVAVEPEIDANGHNCDWWELIDKRAALREQFPSLAKVKNELPGCKADRERQRVFQERRALEKLARQERERELAEARMLAVRERAERERQAREYKKYRLERQLALQANGEKK